MILARPEGAVPKQQVERMIALLFLLPGVQLLTGSTPVPRFSLREVII